MNDIIVNMNKTVDNLFTIYFFANFFIQLELHMLLTY